MGVNPISLGSPHVRPVGVHRTCGEPNEIKVNTHPTNITALFRDQAPTKPAAGGEAEGARHEPFTFTPMGGQFDFAWLSARTPHGAYVR